MTDPLLVPRRQLRLGPLLAEGGEGRVYELADRPDLVYKAYRVAQPLAGLVDLLRWPVALPAGAASRLRGSTAWPVAAVVSATEGPTGLGKASPPTGLGLLLPRAPRRFSLRHRDGRSHLASLSYLTADPDRRSAAYGIDLPPPMGPERLGLVYALARLIEGFESATPTVSHGDLSAKNVLWSLARGPEVFVLDCDNGERYAGGGALGPADRRRAMTPNWDDPAIAAGANPGPESDRYSLALIFLRVCGAAHYPIQKRQKAGEAISLEIGVPGSARRARSLAAGAALWDVCAAGLAVGDPGARPPASAWVAALETVLLELGATRILDAVWAAQGRAPLDAPPCPAGAAVACLSPARPPGGAEVVVRPVPLIHRSPQRPSQTAVASATGAPGGGWTAVRSQTGGSVARPLFGPVGPSGLGQPVAPGTAPTSALSQLRSVLLAVVAWIVAEHRRTLGYLRVPDRRRRGLWRIPWCITIDFVAACVVLFLAAMIASPFLGV